MTETLNLAEFLMWPPQTRCFSMSRILPWKDGSFQVISFRG